MHHNLKIKKNRHTSTQIVSGTQTKASSSTFSLHSDVNIPFIFRPQRLTRFHDVAALLSLICFSCPFCHSINIHVVVACGWKFGCVIWFIAEREHLFYKASAPSIPQASWRQTRTIKPVSHRRKSKPSRALYLENVRVTAL